MSVRRLVKTSNGFVLLSVLRAVGRLRTTVRVYNVQGWEQPEKQGVASGLSEADELQQTADLAEALQQAAAIPRAEAEAIAAETLRDWADHVAQPDPTQTVGRTLGRLFAVAAAIVLIFIALLVVVLLQLLS